MAEIDSTLPGNLLKEVSDEQRAMRSEMHVMTNDMRSIKGPMASFMSNEVVQDTRIAEIIERIERVEHRLKLREES